MCQREALASHALREAYPLVVKTLCEEAEVKLRRRGRATIFVETWLNTRKKGSLVLAQFHLSFVIGPTQRTTLYFDE